MPFFIIGIPGIVSSVIEAVHLGSFDRLTVLGYP